MVLSLALSAMLCLATHAQDITDARQFKFAGARGARPGSVVRGLRTPRGRARLRDPAPSGRARLRDPAPSGRARLRDPAPPAAEDASALAALTRRFRRDPAPAASLVAAASAGLGAAAGGVAGAPGPKALDFPFAPNPGIKDFETQPGVVIVTKIHGLHQSMLLEQSLCLLHSAYNSRVLYDIVVFTAEPLPEADVRLLKGLVAPARLAVRLDNRGLQAEIAALSSVRREKFLARCRDANPGIPVENITWWTRCPMRLAYNWQAEFRSWHIWRHPALAEYTHMLWLDSDSFATKRWPVDPVAYAMRHDLVMFFDHWPQGAFRMGQERVLKTFGKTLCRLKVEDGRMVSDWGDGDACINRRVPDIHGFFHITNLDYYRSDLMTQWAENLIGDCFLCREYDDQAAVTVPAALLPNRSRDMRGSGIELDLYHNLHLDGQGPKVGGFLKYYPRVVKGNLPETDGKCRIRAGMR